MERHKTGQDVLDEIWNESRKENFFDSDSNFSYFEENSGGKEDDKSVDSHDSEGEDSFDGEYSSDEGQESSLVQPPAPVCDWYKLVHISVNEKH